MRYLGTWASGMLVAAVLIGCGPGKELPDEIPRSTDPTRNATETREKIPTTSDPAAMEIVERAINAHTQSNPSLIAKAKVSKVTAKGSIKLGGERPARTTRVLSAYWPNDLKWTYSLLPPEAGEKTFILNRTGTWCGLNGARLDLNPQKVKEDMQTAGLGEHWLVLLFPLLERNAVVYDLRKGVGVGTPPADVVRVSIPGRPIYRLQFAPGTGLLTQVDYQYTDMIGPAFHEWILSDYKTYSGLLLPSQMKRARTAEHPKFRDLVEEWSVENWEFPEKLDEGAFDPPK